MVLLRSGRRVSTPSRPSTRSCTFRERLITRLITRIQRRLRERRTVSCADEHDRRPLREPTRGSASRCSSQLGCRTQPSVRGRLRAHREVLACGSPIRLETAFLCGARQQAMTHYRDPARAHRRRPRGVDRRAAGRLRASPPGPSGLARAGGRRARRAAGRARRRARGQWARRSLRHPHPFRIGAPGAAGVPAARDRLGAPARARGHAGRFGVGEVSALVDDEGSASFAERFGFREVDRQVEQVRTLGEASARLRCRTGSRSRRSRERPHAPPRGVSARQRGYADLATDGPVEVSLERLATRGGDASRGSFVALAGGEIVGVLGPDAPRQPGRRRGRLDRGAARLAAARPGARHARSASSSLGPRPTASARSSTWTQRGNEGMRSAERAARLRVPRGQRDDGAPLPLAARLRPFVRRRGLGRDGVRGFCVFEGRNEWRRSRARRGRRASRRRARSVLKRIEDEGIEFLLLWFTDIEGHLKSFAVTPSEIEAALDDGMGFDGSSITGFNAIEESDMVAIPDPETFTPMPWKEGETKVARMICDVVTPDGQAVRGRPALRPAPRARAHGRAWASTPSTSAPSSSTSSSRTTAAPRRSTRAATSR